MQLQTSGRISWISGKIEDLYRSSEGREERRNSESVWLVNVLSHTLVAFNKRAVECIWALLWTEVV
jgi:hypothetical protein